MLDEFYFLRSIMASQKTPPRFHGGALTEYPLTEYPLLLAACVASDRG